MTPRARILLVDDDEVDFVITKKLLGQVPDAGYQLEWVDSYEEGARALASGRHDACLIDYRLGARSGLDLMRRAGREGWTVPMILLTAYGNREIDAQALALGAVGYLEKARLGPGELDRALRYALAREGMISGLVDQNTELLCMHHVTSILLGAGSLSERMERVVDELAHHLSYPVVVVERITDATAGLLETVATRGLRADDLPSGGHTLVASPARSALLARRPQLALGASSGERADRPWPWSRAAVALPLEADGQVWGALTVADHRPRTIDGDQLQRMAALAGHLSRMLRFLSTGAGPA